MAAASVPRLSWADAGSPAYVAAAQEQDGGYALFGLSASGQDRFRVPLPGRGHAAAAHPDRPEAVAFARRPGTYALVLDCVTGAVIARLTAPDGHSFNGHGAFSLEGDTLYTSEVVADSGEGRIGLWARARGYARIGQIASGGIGPHEIRRLPGRETLVAANGGIQTGPFDREKLNLPGMTPNLSYIAPDTGEIVQQIALPQAQHLASIRHLAVNDAGLVGFAMQWQGPPEEAPALLGLHRFGDAAPVLALADAASHRMMRGYAGSVSFLERGRKIAISSPKGGRVQVFGRSGAFAYEILRTDVCGLAPGAGGLVMTDGLGTFVNVADGKIAGHCKAPRAWDNHLVQLRDI